MSDFEENDVVIEEPAIQKLSHKTSCLKKTCFNACGCLVLVLIGSFIFLRMIASPNEQNLKTIPETLKTQIPLYDTESLQKITFAAGKEKQNKIGLLVFLPKLIISPFVVHFPEKFLATESFSNTSTKKEILYTFMRAPITEAKDSYTLEWENLTAEPDFIYNFYKDEMEKKKFTTQYDQSTEDLHQLLFSSTSSMAAVRIEDKKNIKNGTDRVIMNISILNTNTE